MIYLVKPSLQHKGDFIEMMHEWKEHGGRINPGVLKKFQGNYSKWLEAIKLKEDESFTIKDKVPSTTYFVMDGDSLIGAINIRHRLNDILLISGGHIAYGIRPTQRRKGYAKLSLELALNQCKELNLYKLLITCDKDNIASSKTIISQGGIFENEVVNDKGILIERYWIELI